jgi:glycosyltransferase 2 family protein
MDLKKILQAGIIIVCFGFVAFYLYGQLDVITSFEWKFDYAFLAVSFLLFMAYFIISGLVWNNILRRLGGTLPQKKAVSIYLVSRLGNYLPGKVWGIFGRVLLCEKDSVPKAKASLSIAIEIIASLTAGLVVFFVSLLFWPDMKGLSGMMAFLLLIPVGMALLHPSIFSRAIRVASKKMNVKSAESDIRYKDTLLFLSYQSALWTLYGLSMVLMISSFYPLDFSLAPIVIGVLSLSWVVGFLSFITPSGIGVREGVTSLLLSLFMPPSIAIIISLAARVWLTLIEAVAILIFLKFK